MEVSLFLRSTTQTQAETSGALRARFYVETSEDLPLTHTQADSAYLQLEAVRTVKERTHERKQPLKRSKRAVIYRLILL